MTLGKMTLGKMTFGMIVKRWYTRSDINLKLNVAIEQNILDTYVGKQLS
jgi:hypothetical protein